MVFLKLSSYSDGGSFFRERHESCIDVKTDSVHICINWLFCGDIGRSPATEKLASRWHA